MVDDGGVRSTVFSLFEGELVAKIDGVGVPATDRRFLRLRTALEPHDRASIPAGEAFGASGAHGTLGGSELAGWIAGGDRFEQNGGSEPRNKAEKVRQTRRPDQSWYTFYDPLCILPTYSLPSSAILHDAFSTVSSSSCFFPGLDFSR